MRAWQVRRPWKISTWLSMVQSRLGNRAPTACSTLTGSVSLGPAEPAHEPAEVGVDGDAGHPERVAQHDVGGLAPDTGQGHQVGEPAGHLAVEALDDGGTEVDHRVRLGPEEAGRPKHGLHLVAVGAGERLGGGPAREQRGRDRVDHDVGRLGRQHRGDEQLQRRLEVELAVGVRVALEQRAVDAAGPAGEGDRGLGGEARAPGGAGGRHGHRVSVRARSDNPAHLRVRRLAALHGTSARRVPPSAHRVCSLAHCAAWITTSYAERPCSLPSTTRRRSNSSRR